MYPTKKEILENKVLFKKETYKTLKDFKRRWRETERIDHRQKLLEDLVKEIARQENKAEVYVTFYEKITNHYNKSTKTININNTSIITALHELAHHLFGSSELQACRWSIWLFKKTFPNSYKKLKWDGHMLKKNEKEKRNNRVRTNINIISNDNTSRNVIPITRNEQRRK